MLGQLSINHLRAIVSTPHLAMKIPFASGDIVIVHVDQKVARECYVTNLKVKPTDRPHHRESLRGQCCDRTREQSQRSQGSSRGQSREMKAPRKEHMVALGDLNPRFNDAHIEPVQIPSPNTSTRSCTFNAHGNITNFS